MRGRAWAADCGLGSQATGLTGLRASTMGTTWHERNCACEGSPQQVLAVMKWCVVLGAVQAQPHPKFVRQAAAGIRAGYQGGQQDVKQFAPERMHAMLYQLSADAERVCAGEESAASGGHAATRRYSCQEKASLSFCGRCNFGLGAP